LELGHCFHVAGVGQGNTTCAQTNSSVKVQNVAVIHANASVNLLRARPGREFKGVDRGQTTLFPECLEDWIGEDNPVHTRQDGAADGADRGERRALS
jgi:hypothetical protein